MEIAWECPTDAFRISWRESGGPEVQAPQTRGFGTNLIVDVPERMLDARVRLAYEPGGVEWELETDASVTAAPTRLAS